jgi:hypothetical protein
MMVTVALSVRLHEALGFDVMGRSALDQSGPAHPILHMRREGPVVTITSARPKDLAAADGDRARGCQTPHCPRTRVRAHRDDQRRALNAPDR